MSFHFYMVLKFLLKVFVEEVIEFVKRNYVREVVQIDVRRTGDNQQVLVVSFEFLECFLTCGK